MPARAGESRAHATLLCLGALLCACSATTPDPAADPRTITVLAAASLTEALRDSAAAFEAHGGATVRLSFGGSDILANQLLQGAPAELFLSASDPWMARVVAAGEALGEPAVVARNRLVCVQPRGTPPLGSAASLVEPRFRVIALGREGVPAGDYGREALRRLGLEQDLAQKLVGMKDVRAVLHAVASGEAEAGIVYRTDALVEPSVVVAFELEPGLHAPIVYPGVVLRRARDPEAARAFLSFLLSPAGQALLEGHGFGGAAEER